MWMFANVHACVATICTKHVCYHIWLTSLPCLLLVHPLTLIWAVSDAEEGGEVFTLTKCLQQCVIGNEQSVSGT